jgi:hypothetical protein
VTYAVVGKVANSNRALKPSMSASTAIATDERADVIRAPEGIAFKVERDFPRD